MMIQLANEVHEVVVADEFLGVFGQVSPSKFQIFDESMNRWSNDILQANMGEVDSRTIIEYVKGIWSHLENPHIVVKTRKHNTVVLDNKDFLTLEDLKPGDDFSFYGDDRRFTVVFVDISTPPHSVTVLSDNYNVRFFPKQSRVRLYEHNP